MLWVVPIAEGDISLDDVRRVAIDRRLKDRPVVLLPGHKGLRLNAVLQLVDLRIAEQFKTRLNAEAGHLRAGVFRAANRLGINRRQVALYRGFDLDDGPGAEEDHRVALIGAHQQVGVGVPVQVEVSGKRIPKSFHRIQRIGQITRLDYLRGLRLQAAPAAGEDVDDAISLVRGSNG